MKTVIIGAGAMGSLFGGLLSLSGNEVWLVDIWKEHIDAIRSKGLAIEEKGKVQVLSINATKDIASIWKADLILYFVKTYHTEKAVRDSLALGKEDTPLNPFACIDRLPNGYFVRSPFFQETSRPCVKTFGIFPDHHKIDILQPFILQGRIDPWIEFNRSKIDV